MKCVFCLLFLDINICLQAPVEIALAVEIWKLDRFVIVRIKVEKELAHQHDLLGANLDGRVMESFNY